MNARTRTFLIWDVLQLAAIFLVATMFITLGLLAWASATGSLSPFGHTAIAWLSRLP